MLIQWDQELLWNFYIDSSRNLSVLYNPVLQVMGFFFDLQHVLGISTFWKPSHPPFCTQASVSWCSAFDGSLGHSGGTLSTFLLWPKLLASSGLLTLCGGPVYPRVFLWAWCSGAGFCSLLCFAHLKQIFQLTGPALSLLQDHAVDSVKGLWERTGRLMRMHIVTGAFQNCTP